MKNIHSASKFRAVYVGYSSSSFWSQPVRIGDDDDTHIYLFYFSNPAHT